MVEMSPYFQDIARAVNGLQLPQEGNVLITGATGLIGSCLVDMLMLHSHCHVYTMGRNAQRASLRFGDYQSEERFHLLLHDVTQPLQSDTDFHYIIHAASNASPNFFSQSPVEVMKANLNGLCHLVEFGLHHHLQRMVYVSSGEIYGEGDGSIFTETSSGYIDILSPRACYPSSKRAAETLCAAYVKEYGAQIVIARPCHTYGPYFTESDNRVYAEFVRNVLNNEDIVMKSKGEPYRSWLYVIDCAAALLLLLTKGKSGEAYNVADSRSNITIRQLAEKVAQIGQRKVVFDLKEGGNTTPITKAVFATDKLERLGWKPLFSIDEGLQNTILTMKKYGK
ncbi:MAG: NAD-dependent epimerase/dehydratase family protein [Prevotella sp.]|nr:NAD-dependent epimerase/dehydratase family protein [Prevotella sp.]